MDDDDGIEPTSLNEKRIWRRIQTAISNTDKVYRSQPCQFAFNGQSETKYGVTDDAEPAYPGCTRMVPYNIDDRQMTIVC